MATLTDALKLRRSAYKIGKALPVDEEEIARLVNEATVLVPDAFDMKSQRVILALGEKHDKLWDAIYDAFGGKVAREKIDGFKAGYGTVLYFYDSEVVRALQGRFPPYAANFPIWAQQANGMLQLSVWAALAELGVGTNIQHYNPVIDEAVRTFSAFPRTTCLWRKCRSEVSWNRPHLRPERTSRCASASSDRHGKSVKQPS